MSNGVLKRISIYVGKYKLFLILGLISAIISVALSLFIPVLIGDGVDLIISPGNVNFPGMIPILITLAVSIVISALFNWLMTLCTNIVTHRTVRDIRKDAFEKLHRLPLKYVDSNAHGDIMARVVADIDQMSDGLLQGFAQLFTGVVTIAGTILFMLSINVYITLLVIVLTPISLFVASFIAKMTFNKFKVQSKVRGELGGVTEEMLTNQAVLKAYSGERRAQSQFEEVNARLYKIGVQAQFYSSLTNPCTRFVNNMVYAAVGIVGALTAISGGLTIGGISCFLAYANQYTKPFNEISGVVTELQSAFASAKRVFDIIDESDEAPDAKDAVTIENANGAVTAEHVDFSYKKSKKLITDFNLETKRGQRIAIVGPTGCGKTTLINLLMRFYDVNRGKITVNGVDIRNIKRDNLRSLYGMVLQDTWLFSGTVKENIAYGVPGATDEQIIAAAKAAYAHSFIKRLPDGYDTVIGEDGGSISQGQKQLLCIARVMLKNPSMLILDEATSSIDTRTELKIQKAFNKMMQGKTSFIVAHRLSTIKEADVILVMRDGNIIEQGTHDELLAKKGFYADLYQSQFKAS